MGRSTEGDEVERATQVPDVYRPAEDRDRAGGPARGPIDQGGLPRARDRRDALLQLARETAGGRAHRPGGQGGALGREGAVEEEPRTRAHAWLQGISGWERVVV